MTYELTHPDRRVRHFSSVLAAVDGSPSSQAALDVACSLVGHTGRLTILHVHVPHVVLSGRHVQTAPEPSNERRAGVAALQAAREHARLDYQLEPEIESLDGDPTDTILESAERTGVDAIIVGSRGLSGLQRLLLGSVAEGLMQRSSRPAVVVHVPAGTR